MNMESKYRSYKCIILIHLLLLIVIFPSYGQSDTLHEHLVNVKLLVEGVNTYEVNELDSAELSKFHGQTTDQILNSVGGVFIKQCR